MGYWVGSVGCWVGTVGWAIRGAGWTLVIGGSLCPFTSGDDLDSHLDLILPECLKDLPKVARAEFLAECEFIPGSLPVVTVRQRLLLMLEMDSSGETIVPLPMATVQPMGAPWGRCPLCPAPLLPMQNPGRCSDQAQQAGSQFHPCTLDSPKPVRPRDTALTQAEPLLPGCCPSIWTPGLAAGTHGEGSSRSERAGPHQQPQGLPALLLWLWGTHLGAGHSQLQAMGQAVRLVVSHEL